MILLDTDHISVLQWEGEAAERLRRRMADSTDEWLGITSSVIKNQERTNTLLVFHRALSQSKLS